MKKNFLIYCFSLAVVAVIFVYPSHVSAGGYKPEISGSFESGDRLYTDPGNSDWDYPRDENFVDYLRYNKQWLKYKQKLAPYEYYYLKFERYEREYDIKSAYDNISYKIEGNYTFYLKEGLRNRIKIMLRDKDYTKSEIKSYHIARINYSWQFSLNEKHDYEIFLQKQWTKYYNDKDKDYNKDRVGISWGWKINSDLDIDTKFQVERQLHNSRSDSTDKFAKKISIKFKYKL
ncbi:MULTISPECIES: hypothetical protein [unclassified Halanaerobium]|uniref:hypothetical protein n=1 Tax=unclassified Halanaerobium TaxID=2641197 RepID=UPI000DF481F2|nr:MULTISPECIES: hypothetical protein [unclassified Halanaerobium]RCW43829.1 hypothetical protein DFR78_12328 [Halanaerobium sp. MA284_MarDTE_T2]RCW80530.1 hypothetical protein DER71_12925 [Halanaerobium sp. DL-01]